MSELRSNYEIYPWGNLDAQIAQQNQTLLHLRLRQNFVEMPKTINRDLRELSEPRTIEFLGQAALRFYPESEVRSILDMESVYRGFRFGTEVLKIVAPEYVTAPVKANLEDVDWEHIDDYPNPAAKLARYLCERTEVGALVNKFSPELTHPSFRDSCASVAAYTLMLADRASHDQFIRGQGHSLFVVSGRQVDLGGE